MLYVVVMTLNPGVTINDAQAAMQPAHSWYRCTQTSWVICSNENAQIWVGRLMPHCQPQGTLFVSRLNPADHQGYMTQEFWNWWNLHRAHAY